MAWTKEWTIDSVAGNYKALGMVDREDIEQLIADSRELIVTKVQLEIAEAGYALERKRANALHQLLEEYNWKSLK